MPDALVRDIDATALERLKKRAQRRGRSLQAELKEILEQAAQHDPEDGRRLAAGIRRKLAGRRHRDSAALIAAARRR